MLQQNTSLKVILFVFSPEKNTVLARRETGQQKAHGCKVSKLLSLRAMSVFTEATYSAWASCHFNSRKAKEQTPSV